MKNIILFILFSYCFPLLIHSQTILKGIVKNKQGKPLLVYLTVQDKGGASISAYTSSDIEGKYHLTYKGTADTLILTVSGMTVGKHYKTVNNQSQTINFNIEEKLFELKEITVIPTPVYRTGDTLNYIVDAFTGKDDRVIEDVLKKMPGIEISSNGKITYNGKKISRFYIENLDLLQGRYSIATKNITAKDVASVQILENHQPIKVLEGKIFSEDAAINLKLKNEAKGILALNAMTGAGYKPTQWSTELVALFFCKKTQNISTYKGNNHGDDIASELKSHYDYEQVTNDRNMLSISEPSTPPVTQKYYLDNLTNLITINQLIKLRNKEIVANISYYNDRINKKGYSYSEQFFPGDNSLRMEEWVKSTSNTNNLEISLRRNINTNKQFRKNCLNIKGYWNNVKATGITCSNAGTIKNDFYQILEKPKFSVDNTLDLLKNIGNKTYRLHFYAEYKHQPHCLRVTPANHLGNYKLATLEQNVHLKNLTSTIKSSFGLKLGHFYLDYSPWINIDICKLDTDLIGKNIFGAFIPASDSLRNILWYNTYQMGLNQIYTYSNKGNLKATFSVPVINYFLEENDRILTRYIRYNRWIFNPTISVSYNLSNDLTALIGGKFKNSYGNMNDAYTGIIMHSYRSLLRNTVDKLFQNYSGESNFSLEYRNAIHSLFINSGLNYGKSKKNLLYGYYYEGIQSVKTTFEQPTVSESYGIKFNGSKGFRFWHTTLRIAGGYNKSKSELLIQNKILHYRSNIYHIGTSFDIAPSDFISFNYNFGWLQNQNYTKELPERVPSFCSYSHKFKIWMFPIRNFSINLNGEYQNNKSLNSHCMTFADALIRYKLKKIEWELEWNNLFNSKQYISRSYANAKTSYYSYDLHPMSIFLKIRFKIK